MSSSDFVKLPEKLTELQNRFPGQDLERILVSSQNPDNFSTDQSLVRKYAGGALLAGRPLSSATIFMGGITGAGKSTTINVLFGDPNLCGTSSNVSSTKDVFLIRKQLKVFGDKLPIIGNLSFVDGPGTFDTNSKNEAMNLASIRKFVENFVELAPRKGLASQIREVTFPNIVLFAARATDNRISGPDSFFRKSLQILKDTAPLVDVKRPNFIVVLTHSMSLPRKQERFIEALAEKCAAIRQIVHEVLGIIDVDVVPVENAPEDYDLEKVGDFYKLPNGQLSHFNLFQVMLHRFDKNGDLLGRFLVDWYYKPSCPEKKNKAEVVKQSAEITDENLAFAGFILAKLNISILNPDEPRKLTWLYKENGATAPYAVIGGNDTGNNLYVIRAPHEGGSIPGKLHFGYNHAYVPFGGGEHFKYSYEILTAPRFSTEWKPSIGSNIHPDAIVAGRDPTGSGESYYIGRANHNGTVTCGKVHPSHRCCYISYGGKEYSYGNYEILIKTEYGKCIGI